MRSRTFILSLLLIPQFLLAGLPNEQVITDGRGERTEETLSISFTENKGQVSDQHYKGRQDVLYYGESNGLTFHLRNNGVSYQQYRIESWTSMEELGFVGDLKNEDIPDEISVYRVDMNWKGINNDFWIEKGEALTGYNNYYLTSCPEGALRVKSYENITYKNIYNGIDLKWYKNRGALEYDFIVSPGSDYKVINWEIKGAKRISINNEGHLIIKTPLGDIVSEAPVGFQNGKEISTRWILDENEISFEVGNYNTALPLIIDPLVRQWGTFFGSIYGEYAHGAAKDDSNNIIVSGMTASPHTIATSGAHQTVLSGINDAFLVKFDKDGTLKWATYYGGPTFELNSFCSTDGNYNVYLSGTTYSDSAIASSGSYQSAYNDKSDAFLVKFNGNGVRQWATYFGSSGYDNNHFCTTDGSSNVYIVGETTSSTNIASSGSYQSSISGTQDGFIAKFNSNGVKLWSTYYGGNGEDKILSCDVDIYSNLYVCGRTNSSNSMSSTSSHQSVNGGGGDAFLAKFGSNGSRIWSTYYGGGAYDEGLYCSVDNVLNVYMSGQTWSSSGMATINSHQNTYGGGGNPDAFLVKLDSSGIRQWATYYGSDSLDRGAGCAVDQFGNVYLTGETNSTDTIATNPTHQGSLGQQMLYKSPLDAFLVKFNDAGIRLWGTYYGGNRQDNGVSCIISSPNSEIYLIGQSDSWDFNTISTQGSHQYLKGGGEDAFIVKFNQCNHVSDTIYPSACVQYHSPSGNFYTVSGTYLDSFPKEDGCDSILTIHLTIGDVDTSITQNGIELSSNAEYSTYQWVNCDSNMIPISGETNKIFTAATNGSYAVIITQDSCSDTSACYTVTGIGIAENSRNQSVRIFPNPTKDVIEITSTDEIQSIYLYDITGRLLQSHNDLSENQYSLSLKNLLPAVYILRVETSTQVFQERISKVE